MSAHVTSRLSAFLDRELTEAEAALVRQHLGDCEACAAHLRDLEGADRAFAEMPADPPAGYFDSFAARVRSRIAATPAVHPERARWPGPLRLPLWSWAVAAALLLGVVLPRLPWDGGRPKSRAEREGIVAAPAAPPAAPPAAAAAPAPAEEPFATAPASRAQAAATERGDPAFRARANPPLGVPTAGPPSAAALRDARPSDAFAESRLEETVAAPGLPAWTTTADEAPARKKDAERDVSRSIGNEAGRTSAKEERGPTRAQGFADAPALAKAATPAAALAANEAAAPVPAGVGAGTVAMGQVEEGKRRPAGSEKGMRAGGLTADPDAEAQFQALLTRRPKSLLERRRLREAWRSFLARDPEGPHADEARVAVVTASVDIAVQSRVAADETEARRDAESYLAWPGAAQESRVQALLRRLEGSR